MCAQKKAAILSDSMLVMDFEDQCLQRWARNKNGFTGLLHGSHGSGKNTMLDRYLSVCEKRNKIPISVDFSQFEPDELKTLPRYLGGIATRLAREVGRPEPNAAEWFLALNLTNYIEDEILGPGKQFVVLAFRRIDVLLGCDFKDDVMSMFRVWDSNRASNERRKTWCNVDLVFTSVVSDVRLISDPRRSPFPHGHVIRLSPFNMDQCRRLVANHGVSLSELQIEVLHGRIHGHPLLWHLLLEHSKQQGVSPLSAAFADAYAPGPFLAYLQRLKDWLVTDPALYQAFLAFVEQGTLPGQDNLLGLLLDNELLRRDADRHYTIFCPLYEDYFK